MATWKPDNLTVKGAVAAFHERLAEIPTIWQNHCAQYGSTTSQEQYVFPGFIPKPRLFLDGRQIQGLRDFTYTITNNEYELSLAINRKHWEDDQVGLIASRMREVAEVWGTYKDFLFSELLVNGATAGNNGFDGATFYQSTRTIGDSGTIDNTLTSNAAAADNIPDKTEFIADLKLAKTQMRDFNDDTGRPFNTLAVGDLRVVVPADYESAAFEALNAQFISQTDNVFAGMAQLDVLDYLTADNKMYINAVGAERKPFVYQERTPLEVIVLDSPDMIALHDAVLVLTRQRFVFGYGDPRRSIEHTYT